MLWPSPFMNCSISLPSFNKNKHYSISSYLSDEKRFCFPPYLICTVSAQDWLLSPCDPQKISGKDNGWVDVSAPSTGDLSTVYQYYMWFMYPSWMIQLWSWLCLRPFSILLFVVFVQCRQFNRRFRLYANNTCIVCEEVLLLGINLSFFSYVTNLAEINQSNLICTAHIQSNHNLSHRALQ